MTTSDTTSDNKWQCVTASDSSGSTNENGTVHFKEWMIAILSMTKTDTLLLQGMDRWLQLEWLNRLSLRSSKKVIN